MLNQCLKFLMIILLACPMSAAAVGDTAGDEAMPNFTGNWVLNERLSDSFMPAQPAGEKGGRGGGGGRSGSRGGRRGGGGSHNGGSNQQPSAKIQERVARLKMEMSRLEIFHDAGELNVTNGLDISHLLFTDGRAVKIWTQRGEASATANWQNRTLAVEWKTSQDTTTRLRRYSVAKGGQRLTITEKRRVPQSDQYRNFTLVYDKQE